MASTATNSLSADSSTIVTERLVFIPRDQKCSLINGKMGIGIAEWIEEVQECMSAGHLAVANQAFFKYS